ncbi:ArsR/SmtB family transcription factor [Anaerosporobacter faecicola]|uniref:ArsR/SmtB family transcription factor n=1 Tax=Anaerosporobacter faecicola TaxID=2718714 RepID=UPI001439A935|nr:metalloregulator ArsR/SmtB family transcription factor [Anaerosporobacter faecicola]
MEHTHLPHDHGNYSQEEYDQILKHTDFQTVSDIFKQLSDSSRLQIYWLLCHCEECVINISAMVSMSSPAVSHHLRILKSNGLIVSRREGKEVYYRASDSETSKELHHMIEIMMSIHCPIE